ncbi:FAD/NAD(P)-binding domain-containing protein [Athelia psychrophila]|uniref:FAD/NAD(P)-binding domain-containing protein n=1 Tax=Athelia psychrophila TaxID=1759441 RepID=A0A166MHZ6_9AGAM|nr:FAD/NAD(P)-binding domain-containing protein [Fibularhizoctonia sp. CBS 109695]
MQLPKTVAVLGGSYGGYHAAQILAEGLPEGWRVVLIDRNSHVNHVYVLSRYGVLPGHEHKAFIPYTRAFHSVEHLNLHASITSLSTHSLTLSKSFPEHGLTDVLHFDYAIYALGSHLPSPINLWGAPPPIKGASAPEAPYGGTKVESMAWLQHHQQAVGAADSVLVVGGGALGIQYATDIAAVHPGKRVTLLHSRHRLLPRFDPSMHSEILEAMDELRVNVILGERLDLDSTREEPPKRNQAGQRIVRTVTGREVAADLLLLCTGQQANTELLESMDSRTVVRQNGMAKVLRTLQLGIESASAAETPLRSSALPTPAPEPAYAYAEDDGVDSAQLDIMLAQMNLLAPDSDYFASSDETLAPSSETEKVEEYTPYLHLFAIGDAADSFGAINAGHTAYYQGEVAARNILKLVGLQEREESGARDTSEDDELEHYEPGPPGIKVTLGLRKSVFQSQGVVGTKNDGVEDLQAGYMWASHGFPDASDDDMRI